MAESEVQGKPRLVRVQSDALPLSSKQALQPLATRGLTFRSFRSLRASNCVADICQEAIGSLAITISWGSGVRVQAAHSILLVVIGLYTISLQQVCPKWLEDNMSAEAIRVGSDLGKHKEVVRIAIGVLGIIDFACVLMGMLTRHACTSAGIRKLVEHTYADVHRHANAIKTLRGCYGTCLSAICLVIFIFSCISGASDMPHPAHFLLAWSPALLPCWMLLHMVAFIRVIGFLALAEVRAFYAKLQATEDAYSSASYLECNVASGYWLTLLREHQELVDDLTGVSKAISSTVLMFQNVVAALSIVMLCVGRATRGAPTTSSWYVLLAFVVANTGTFAMMPLASITELCQSRRMGRQSLLTLADKYSGWPMPAELGSTSRPWAW
eukprot:TRINITY_DN5410_c2_g1_i1.p1 TRINITY_DN5410_c2_g1~~TRINITY_DN5410_c2_g1_i1.p1  ORF type:complete len:383 (-),score=57.96 TRINITY_DN5410_c2_g1_i1:238-1386(-)